MLLKKLCYYKQKSEVNIQIKYSYIYCLYKKINYSTNYNYLISTTIFCIIFKNYLVTKKTKMRSQLEIKFWLVTKVNQNQVKRQLNHFQSSVQTPKKDEDIRHFSHSNIISTTGCYHLRCGGNDASEKWQKWSCFTWKKKIFLQLG